MEETEAVATRVWTEGRTVYVELTDQRIVGFAAARFRRLRDASDRELAEVSLEVAGAATLEPLLPDDADGNA